MSRDQTTEAAALLHSDAGEWLAAVNKAPRLYMPFEWGSAAGDTKCSIQYDASRKLLKVVSDDSLPAVVDIINPSDIIGVDVEIKLFDSTSDLVESCFKNMQDQVVNIFDQVFENEDYVFSGKDDILKDSQATAVLNLYAYPKSPKKTGWCSSSAASPPNLPNPNYMNRGEGPRSARHLTFQVAAAQDFHPLSELVKAIRSVSGLPFKKNKPQYLVILNPKSGTGQARRVWKETVEPMLVQQAGVLVDLKETNYSRHADVILRDSPDLQEYDAVLCIGGDGIIHEVLQGIHARPDAAEIWASLKLGVLGCGTGNGLAKSLTFAANEHHSILESTFLIARGQTIPMDLSHYETTTKKYTSFLTFTYGIIADLDIESEFMRCLGSMRHDLWAVWRVMFLKRYPAKLSYLPACSNEEIEMPALSEPVPSHWTVLEDDFVLFWASQASHAAIHTYSSPPTSMHDGVFQILVLRGKNLSRFSIASVLLSLESGSHATHSEFIPCVAYRLEPYGEGSFNDLDGEVIESGPIQACVRPKAVHVFGSLGSPS